MGWQELRKKENADRIEVNRMANALDEKNKKAIAKDKKDREDAQKKKDKEAADAAALQLAKDEAEQAVRAEYYSADKVYTDHRTEQGTKFKDLNAESFSILRPLQTTFQSLHATQKG